MYVANGIYTDSLTNTSIETACVYIYVYIVSRILYLYNCSRKLAIIYKTFFILSWYNVTVNRVYVLSCFTGEFSQSAIMKRILRLVIVTWRISRLGSFKFIKSKWHRKRMSANARFTWQLIYKTFLFHSCGSITRQDCALPRYEIHSHDLSCPPTRC